MLKREVAHLQSVITALSNENTKLKATLLDLQCRSMHDNLLFMRIEEREVETYESSEATVRKVMKEHLKTREEEVKHIQLERVHRLGPHKGQNKEKPKPLMVKFASAKCKDQILSLSKRLKGTHFYLSNQYPAEIVEKNESSFQV